MPLAQVARLENIPRSTVERAAGRTVVQYRAGVLPLVSLPEMLGGSADADADPIPVVVYKNAQADLGLVVDEIIDIVEETVVSPHGSDRPGLLGSAVVGGLVTDFLDLEAVVRWAPPASGESLGRLLAAISSSEQESPQECPAAEVSR
jgi:two-component system chemotaxis sensor kinase CheA